MKVQTLLKPALIGLVCFGLITPQTVSAGLLPTPKSVKAKSASRTSDVTLTKDGILRGVIVDGKAGPVTGEKVVIRQGRRVIAQTKTDKLGEFRVPKFKGGTYEVTAGKISHRIRVWTADAAPKSARKVALLVENRNVVRAQGTILPGTALNAVGIGLGAAGLALGIDNRSEINDVENQANRNSNSINGL